MRRPAHISLLWKILLSTSIAITLLFAVTGWIVQDQFVRIASVSLEEEVRGSFQAYESLWRSRADQLASLSLVVSRESYVRAAFRTGDQLTIRDTAGELWDTFSRAGSFFLVTDPNGGVIASLGGKFGQQIGEFPAARMAASKFPNQAAGFLLYNGRLLQIVVTPVYVAATQGSALLDILVAGYEVDATLAQHLKDATGGSEFDFSTGSRTVASTLGASTLREGGLRWGAAGLGQLRQARLGGAEYLGMSTPLPDVTGSPVGELRILRSFDAPSRRIAELRRNIVVVWLVFVLAGLGITWTLTSRILQPVHALDLAAAQIGKGNYGVHVAVASRDEIGRLAQTFNEMCASIREARNELIRQERISTIGRLSTSIIHDLRNPLAAIYGGAEMLVDADLPPEHVKRLAANMYRSSRRVQDLLTELSDVTRGRSRKSELCSLREVVLAAYEPLEPAAQSQGVDAKIEVPPDIEAMLERPAMERVFGNLITNAIEAMPEGGSLRIAAECDNGAALVVVENTGAGIPETILPHLFQPFVTAGKKNGLGLGLALARQSVLDHGGDLWADKAFREGARFFVSLPLLGER